MRKVNGLFSLLFVLDKFEVSYEHTYLHMIYDYKQRWHDYNSKYKVERYD